MKRCVIVSGADINNYGFIRDKLCADSHENPRLDSFGKKSFIIDDYSEMEIVSDEPVSICDRYALFFLFNITGCAKDITITGEKYPLVDAEISCEYQYGVRNEVLPGKTATVSVKHG